MSKWINEHHRLQKETMKVPYDVEGKWLNRNLYIFLFYIDLPDYADPLNPKQQFEWSL